MTYPLLVGIGIGGVCIVLSAVVMALVAPEPEASPPLVECRSMVITRDSVAFETVYDVVGNQPQTRVSLFDAETDTRCRTL